MVEIKYLFVLQVVLIGCLVAVQMANGQSVHSARNELSGKNGKLLILLIIMIYVKFYFFSCVYAFSYGFFLTPSLFLDLNALWTYHFLRFWIFKTFSRKSSGAFFFMLSHSKGLSCKVRMKKKFVHENFLFIEIFTWNESKHIK